jgi:alpha-amylase
MPGVCLYFQVHQPRRLRHYTVFDIHHVHAYEDDAVNRQILDKIADKCYLPANAILADLIQRHPGRFNVAFSITGVLLDQLATCRPDVLDSFKQLADTGAVEFLNETYYHSLAFLYSPEEFRQQVLLHRQKIRDLFGQTPRTFRHTELIYNNDLARMIENMGFDVILAEGAEKILGLRSPDAVYQPAGCRQLKLLLRNYRLSDDVAFRFSSTAWTGYPLTAEKFAHWIHHIPNAGVVNLFMDYETFGEHHWRETGILDFLRAFPEEIMKHPDFQFQKPIEAAAAEAVAQLDAPDFISWADTERDLTAWLGSVMQKDAIDTLYTLEDAIRRRRDEQWLQTWRTLQTSDHFYYMCTKWFADGDVHKYFNPYPSPYDAYINYMNILDDFSEIVA